MTDAKYDETDRQIFVHVRRTPSLDIVIHEACTTGSWSGGAHDAENEEYAQKHDIMLCFSVASKTLLLNGCRIKCE